MISILELLKRLLAKRKKNGKVNTFFDSINEIRSLDLPTRIIELYNSQRQYGLLMIDPLFMEDVKWFILHAGFAEIIYEKYNPNNKITMSMPKGKFAFRPISYIPPIDTLIYFSIVDKILLRKKEWISPYVYSTIRETNGKQIFNNPVRHWLRMRDQLMQSAKRDIENAVMICCDISGYFENIKIEKLINEISFFCGRKEKN